MAALDSHLLQEMATFSGLHFGTRLAPLTGLPRETNSSSCRRFGAVLDKEVYSAYQSSSRTRRCPGASGRACRAGIGADSVYNASAAGPAGGGHRPGPAVAFTG